MKERRIHDFIPYIKDYYTIKENGEIYSDNCGIMKVRNKPGTEYKMINFMALDGTKKTFKVHRLVMMAFSPIENYENLQVNHKDGNKANNHIDNLEWVTPRENQLHAFKLGLKKAKRGEDCPTSKLTREDVIKVFELRKEGFTQKEIGDIMGCTHSNISAILNHKSWKDITFNDYLERE